MSDKCKWDNRFLELAEFYSKWSKDPSTQVGCVIVDNNNIVLGLGYNGFPRGVSDSNERIKDRSIKHLIVQHAEVNAVLNSNGKVTGATAYVTHPPCSNCTGLLIQAGIKRIVTYKASSTLAKRYNASFKASLVMLKESGVEMTQKTQKTPINVLSLFDGMSCGQIALERSGIDVRHYYAAEIDKYAMKITQKNHPSTIQLGDVTQVSSQNLPKIDLLIGGSPCQGFSFAGKQLNFDDPRSKLFFEYVRLLKELKPKYFLLENVRMKQESQDVISEALGVKPIAINSNLVSAQNRYRLYWTNIPGVDQPEDKGINLVDIIEDGVTDREKSHCLDANYFKGGNLKSYFEKHRRQLIFSDDGLCHVGEADLKGHDSIKRVYHPDGKCPTLTTMGGGHREPKILIENTTWRKLTPLECERLQTVPDGYTEGVSNTQRYRMLGNGWTVDVISHIFKGLNK